MNTRTRIGLITLLLLLVAVGGWLLSQNQLHVALPEEPAQHATAPKPTLTITGAPPAATAAAQAEDTLDGAPRDNVALAKAIFAQPISVYGRVVDQFGQPIEGAKIRFGVHDKPWERGSEYFRTSDADGRFEIDDVKGAAINTEVFKDGYYNGNESRRIFKPGEPTSKKIPSVFVLYKKGEAEPVIYQSLDSMRLHQGVEIVHFDFKRARLLKSAEGQGQMFVEIVSTPGLERGRYWKYSISIKGGGLQKRTHEFAFSAPESGYIETIAGEYGGQSPSGGEWRNSHSDDYFAMLSDGTKARFKIELGTKRENYMRISEFVYNPKPDSRNLEFDPTKVIKPKP